MERIPGQEKKSCNRNNLCDECVDRLQLSRPSYKFDVVILSSTILSSFSLDSLNIIPLFSFVVTLECVISFKLSLSLPQSTVALFPSLKTFFLFMWIFAFVVFLSHSLLSRFLLYISFYLKFHVKFFLPYSSLYITSLQCLPL